MADRINFSNKLNDSVQVGDELYYSVITGTTVGSETSLGTIDVIGEDYVEVASAGNATTSDFFMFRKPVEENVSSLKGYYAEVEFATAAGVTAKQELFAVGSEITISSK